MREDWLPENRYTLKADVMDSSHVNNILVGSIVNGLVTTTDS
jgi:pentose-5-phosphate-3-epimerase